MPLLFSPLAAADLFKRDWDASIFPLDTFFASLFCADFNKLFCIQFRETRLDS